MALSAEHRRLLLNLSTTVFTASDLRMAVYKAASPQVILENIVTVSALPGQQWIEALDYAERHGWLAPLLQELLDSRRGMHSVEAVLQEVLDALARSATPNWARAANHPAYDLAIGNEAFIDRKALRGAVEELSKEDGFRVLNVVSEATLGKSHSQFLVGHVCERRATFRVVVTNLLEWPTLEATPLEVMRHVAQQMKLEEPTVDLKGLPDNQARLLSNWFVGRLQGMAQQWWLVFDGVRHVDPRTGVRQLVHNLALLAAQRRNLGLRVLLLDCDGKLPKGLRTFQDQLSTPIEKGHVRQWFLDVGIDARVVDSLVTEVFSGLPAEAAEYYYELPLAVFRVARRELG